MWLLHEDVLKELERIRGVQPTESQTQAFDARLASTGRSKPRNRTSETNGVATIRVEGVLTKRPDLFVTMMGVPNTTYSEIQSALRAAQRDPAVKRLRLEVDSPGGAVDGLVDTLESLKAFDKPISVGAENAFSAAYTIAAVAGPIQATGPGARFGSVGVVRSLLVDTEMSPVELVRITNTESPDKAPDVRTEEGRATVQNELDAIFDLLVGYVASGRETTEQYVRTEFGRGAAFLASEARSRGMIDSIRGEGDRTTSSTTAPPHGSEPRTSNFRTERPHVYAMYVHHGTLWERGRCAAHLGLAEASGDWGLAAEAIRSGAEFTQTLKARHCRTAVRTKDEADAEAAVKAICTDRERLFRGAHISALPPRWPAQYGDACKAAWQIGVNQERDRVLGHLPGIDPAQTPRPQQPAIDAIREDREATPSTQARYQLAALAPPRRQAPTRDLGDELADPVLGREGGTPEPAPRDLGDKLADRVLGGRDVS